MLLDVLISAENVQISFVRDDLKKLISSGERISLPN
jgi:hypothetical protein